MEYVNAGQRPRKFDDEVAPSVAERSLEDEDLWEWSIKRFDATWIPEIEAAIARPLPAMFRSLIARFIYPEFQWKEVVFFGNTPERIGNAAHELRVALTRDRRMSEVLMANGYIQFAQPSVGSYDPVCFQPGGAVDAPVVRLDHEEILMKGRIQIVERIASSFEKLISIPAA